MLLSRTSSREGSPMKVTAKHEANIMTGTWSENLRKSKEASLELCEPWNTTVTISSGKPNFKEPTPPPILSRQASLVDEASLKMKREEYEKPWQVIKSGEKISPKAQDVT